MRIQLDIITSLRSRLDIILDEADDDSTTNNLENSLSQKATQVVFHELRYFIFSMGHLYFGVNQSTQTMSYIFKKSGLFGVMVQWNIS